MYLDDYYTLPQRPGSRELSGLHLLKHVINLGENFHNGSWGPYNNSAGNYDQSELREILQLDEYNYINNPQGDSPRARKGVVIPGYITPDGLDILTNSSEDYLYGYIDSLYTILKDDCGFSIFTPSTNFISRNVIINPFYRMKSVVDDLKVVSTYYVNQGFDADYIRVFKDVFNANIQEWKNKVIDLYDLNNKDTDDNETKQRQQFFETVLNGVNESLIENPHNISPL